MPRLALSFVGLALAGGAKAAQLIQKSHCNGKQSCTYDDELCFAVWQNATEPACGFHCKEHGVSIDEDCKLPAAPFYCKDEDSLVERLTVLRYLAIGCVVMYRVWLKIAKGRSEAGMGPDFRHPELAKRMVDKASEGGLLGWAQAWFFGMCLFVQSEGIGLMIYFATAATLDNFSIFVVHPGHEFCEWTTVVALYTGALVTFLPNCILAYTLQGSMYELGKLPGKIGFIAMMVMATGLFFVVRLQVVYELGWAAKVQSILEFNGKGREGLELRQVLAASLTPPMVDLVQSTLLIASSSLRAEVPAHKFKLLGGAPSHEAADP